MHCEIYKTIFFKFCQASNLDFTYSFHNNSSMWMYFDEILASREGSFMKNVKLKLL